METSTLLPLAKSTRDIKREKLTELEQALKRNDNGAQETGMSKGCMTVAALFAVAVLFYGVGVLIGILMVRQNQ